MFHNINSHRFTIPNDENTMSSSSNHRKPSSFSSKKGLALKSIHENTIHCNDENMMNKIKNNNNININTMTKSSLFPKTPSASSTSSRRRALGDISNRKAGAGSNSSSASLVKSSLPSLSSSIKKSKKKKKSSSVSLSKSTTMTLNKNVTFQEIYQDDQDNNSTVLNKDNHKGEIREEVGSSSIQSRTINTESTISSTASNRMKMKQRHDNNIIDVEDIEVSAGRTWEQEQKLLLKKQNDDDILNNIDDLKIDFEEEERIIERNYWLKQIKEHEEDVRLGQEMNERDESNIFIYEDLEPKVYDDELDYVQFSFEERIDDDEDDEYLATRRVCSLDDDDDDDISI